MNRQESVARYLPALSVCLLLLLAGSSAVVAAEEVATLIGEIEVAQSDGGETRAAAIYDPDWGLVLISNEGKGKQLLNHVGAVAEVTGKISEIDDDVAGEYAYEIVVTSYTIEVPAESDSGEDWDPEK